MSSKIVTLTTDFGASDAYVGAMKGAVLSIDDRVALVDISHSVPPQDVAHAAFVLGSAYRYFPPETVHVGVVDPGVGTSRRAILLVTPSGRFLAPDNGLLTYVLADHQESGSPAGPAASRENDFLKPVKVPPTKGCSAYALTNAEYWLRPVSDTFHGRDVFAPVAAHLSRGVPSEQFGDQIDEVVCLNLPGPESQGGTVLGRIIFIDHFGNLVTDIRPHHLSGGEVELDVAGVRVAGLIRSYAEREGLVALIGSHGYLEIAERNGSAALRLGVAVGGRVRLTNAGSDARRVP